MGTFDYHSNAINTPYDVNVSGVPTAASYDGTVVPQDDTSTGCIELSVLELQNF